jgi:tetratricopeptide (TPR) repeat protein
VLVDATDEFLDESLLVEADPGPDSTHRVSSTAPAEVPNAEVIFAGTSDAPPAPSATSLSPALVRAAARPSMDRWRAAVIALAAVLAAATTRRLIVSPAAPAEASNTPPAVAANIGEPRMSASPSAGASPPSASAVPAPSGSAAEAASATAPTDGVDAAAATVSSPEALEAKENAQKALEGGKIAAAIQNGIHAVELDPGDAESWLILGAAYLQRGKPAQARSSFATCVQLATRGPRAECAALVH